MSSTVDAASGLELNVSLEDHLSEALIPLKSLLPAELATQLNVYIGDPPSPTIPHVLLGSISSWSRSQAGQEALQSHMPPLRPQDYSMIALLAGTVTSPERKFPTVMPQSVLAEEEGKRRVADRKAIVAVLNALLSIAGSGVATWLVAERWKHEWVRLLFLLSRLLADRFAQRVLLSFLVAVVVAVSETALFIIWQSRQARKKSRRHNAISVLHKKNDGEGVIPIDSDDRGKDSSLRFRQHAATHQEE